MVLGKQLQGGKMMLRYSFKSKRLSTINALRPHQTPSQVGQWADHPHDWWGKRKIIDSKCHFWGGYVSSLEGIPSNAGQLLTLFEDTTSNDTTIPPSSVTWLHPFPTLTSPSLTPERPLESPECGYVKLRCEAITNYDISKRYPNHIYSSQTNLSLCKISEHDPHWILSSWWFYTNPIWKLCNPQNG